MHYVYFVGYVVTDSGHARASEPFFNNTQVELDYVLDGVESAKKLQQTLAEQLNVRRVVVLGFTRLESA